MVTPAKALSILLTALILFCYSERANAQGEAFLHGRVELQGRVPPDKSDDYYVRFCVKAKQTTSPKQNTKWDLYAFRMKPKSGTVVQVCLSAHGYVPQITNITQVESPSVFAFPLVKLKPVEQHHASAEALRKDLISQARLFAISKDYDIFNFNLGLMSRECRNNPEKSKVLQTFLADSAKQAFMAPQYFSRQGLYGAILARSDGETVAIRPSSLLTLMKDETVPPGIRASAIKALAADKMIDEGTKIEFLTFLRVQVVAPSALLFRPARTALAEIGSPNDKTQILNDLLKSDNSERYLSALIAARKARWDVPNVNPEMPATAKAELENWDTMPQIMPSRVHYVWKDGDSTAGLILSTQMENNNKERWFQASQDGDDKVLKLEYPAGHSFGLLQIMVDQSNGPQTMDFSEYNELVVEIRSADMDRNVDIGIKGAQDPEDQTLFKKTFTGVSTDWQTFHIPLKGPAAQLSSRAAANQLTRLQNLKIVSEFAFGSQEKQVFYIRKIYFARP